jgi:hypothetical protein
MATTRSTSLESWKPYEMIKISAFVPSEVQSGMRAMTPSLPTVTCQVLCHFVVEKKIIMVSLRAT